MDIKLVGIVAGRISRLGHLPAELDINGVSTYISAIDFVTPERLDIHYKREGLAAYI